MLLVFPSQKGFVWVFRGCAPVGRRSGSLPPIQPRLLEDPPILPTDSAIEPHLEAAFEEACRSGLQSYDAIHVTVAALSGCDELVTTEKPTSAIHRTTLIRIVSIDT